jgi:acyl-coenzyme A thioesterase PaaI-like protein|tara:strand:+ start:83 stop:586 length:504 start_codon:yes stop_codon:yes gene_type:complete
MEYKYITGKVLEITGSGWPDGTVLQEIYPDTSFVSGVENPKGMKMVPIIKDRKIYAKYTFEKSFEGGPGLVHGGILSTVLDDMMGYATFTQNLFCVTANLNVNFRAPSPVDKEFELYAWVKEVDGNKVYAESVIQSEDAIHVEADGLFINIGQDGARQYFSPEKQYP